MDSQGLVCKSRGVAKLQEHKRSFAHDVPFQPDLKAAIRALRPTAIIGMWCGGLCLGVCVWGVA